MDNPLQTHPNSSGSSPIPTGEVSTSSPSNPNGSSSSSSSSAVVQTPGLGVSEYMDISPSIPLESGSSKTLTVHSASSEGDPVSSSLSCESGSASDGEGLDEDGDDGSCRGAEGERELGDAGGFGAKDLQFDGEYFGDGPCRIGDHPGCPHYYAPYHFQSRWLMNCDPPSCSRGMDARFSGPHHHPGEGWDDHTAWTCFSGEKRWREMDTGRRCTEMETRGCTEDDEDMSCGISISLLDNGPTGVGAGLSNLGNTCFMNSILQCVTHTVPLVKALRSCNHVIPCSSEEFCVLCTLREHIELSFASAGKIISPVKFFDNLNYISSCFRRYQQEDAHEFLQCFLDRLERCSLDSSSIDKSPSLRDNNLVEQIFGGRLVSKLLCCNCGHYSEKFEPLIDMSLEIEEVSTLESALESFTKVEKIEDAEVKIICENCKEEASMKKQLMLDQAPLVAALHLKRFKTDGSFVEKIGKHVKFPLELNLKPYTKHSQDGTAELKYHLYAFVVHNGFLPTSGHYFCYIRSSPDTWHKLDDSMVIKLEEEEVLSQAAYILFYAREGTPWCSSLVELQNISVDPRLTLYASPKSVLDNVDGEVASCTGLGSTDNSKAIIGTDADDFASVDFFNETNLEGFQTTETLSYTEGKSTEVTDASEQNGPKLYCDESKVDMHMVDASVPLKGSDYPEGVQNTQLSGLHSAEEDNLSQGTADNKRANDVYLPTQPQPICLGPDSDSGELPGTGYKMPCDHLEVETRVNSRGSRNKCNMDPEKREALKYMNKNMPSCRRLKLMAAMVPQNHKRRSRSPPCKKTSSRGSCRKLVSSVEFSR